MLTTDQEHVASNHPDRQRMLDVIRRGLASASRIDISVSFLRFSGLGLIIDDLQRFQARGGVLRLLTSTYLGITQPDAIRVLSCLRGLMFGPVWRAQRSLILNHYLTL